MIEQAEEKLLKQIFSDAHVIDVDFSLWDKSISLCVIADHVASTTPGRLPIFLVEFFRVHRFDCAFNHFDIELGVDYNEADKHIQWMVDAINIKIDENMISVTLTRSGIFPQMEILCGRIAIRQLPSSLLDNLFPDWTMPYSGLARPGIAAMGSSRQA